MAEKRVIELEVKTESVGNLKSELRKAQQEVQKLVQLYGESSQEVAQAARRAAELKDQIEDANDAIAAFKGEGIFTATGKAIQSVASGISAVEGAIGLIGVESEAINETLLRVNSAMALAQGLEGLEDAGRAFKTLYTRITSLTVVQKLSTAAQWLWNAAMNANPLGAIVIAITAVIAAGYKLISFFQESAAENERMSKSIDRNSAALKRQEQQIQNSASRQKEYNSFQYEYAKASGASAEQLRKLAIKHQEEELALANKNKELAKSTYLRQQDILATMMANDADEELIEKQKEVVKQARENATKAREAAVQENKELVALKRQQLVEIRQEQTDANKKEQEAAKEAAEKRREAAKEANEKRIADEKEKNDKLKKLAEDKAKFDLEQIELDEKRQEQAYQRKLDADAKAAEEEKAQEDKYRAEQLAAEEADEKRQEEAWKREQEGIEKLQQLKFEAVYAGLNLISNITEVFGRKGEKEAKRAFQIQKAASIAAATIQTYQSATAAYASQFVPIPDPTSPVRGAIAAGIAVAAGLGNIAKIASQKFDGGGSIGTTSLSGGGGGSQSSGAGTSNVITPNFNVVGNAQATNPLAGLGGQPIQAYVVSGEVTTAQSLDRNRVNYATFG